MAVSGKVPIFAAELETLAEKGETDTLLQPMFIMGVAACGECTV